MAVLDFKNWGGGGGRGTSVGKLVLEVNYIRM